MIPLKKPNLRRCFNFPVIATYAKYAFIPGKFRALHLPAGRQVPDFLSGIMFQGFCST